MKNKKLKFMIVFFTETHNHLMRLKNPVELLGKYKIIVNG